MITMEGNFSEEEQSELRKEFQQKKQEFFNLRSQLNSLNAEKETAYKSLRILREKVRVSSQKMTSLKQERDQYIKQVKEHKQTRDQLNTAVKSKSLEKKEVDEKKKALLEKVDHQENPFYLKKQIEALERKIETEPMAFSKEKEITKQIKQLQARYKEIAKLGEVWKEVNTVSMNFAQTRRQAEESHQEVQKLAQLSQEKHEEMSKLFDELKKIRSEEQPLAEKYLQLKMQFEEQKKKMQELQTRVTELGKLFNEEEEKSFKVKVKEKTAEVKEKMRSGKKLSTADILAFQALKD